MRRVIFLCIFAVAFAAACRSPEEDAATREAVWATTVTHWATQTAPTPSPMPLTATVKAYIDNQWATVLAPTPTQGPPGPTREAIAATTAAYRFAEQTAAVRQQQFLADYEGNRIVIVTVTPVPLPVVTPTPEEICVLVDLNAATLEVIANLPADSLGRRLGTDRAGWVVDFRDSNSIVVLDDLLSIPGIGPRTVAAIRASECTMQR